MQRRPTERYRALALLIVLLGGLLIITFARGWLGALPTHGHLVLGTGAGGTPRHIHDGDPLDRAGRAARPVTAVTPPLAPRVAGGARAGGGGRIISLAPNDGAQPENNAVTFSGALARVGTQVPRERGANLSTPAGGAGTGVSVAPPVPPPRPVAAARAARAAVSPGLEN